MSGTLTFSYSYMGLTATGPISASGQITATPDGGDNYVVASISGTGAATTDGTAIPFTITGLDPTGSYGQNDNLLIVDPGASPVGGLDNFGITFTATLGGAEYDVNLYTDKGQYEEAIFSNGQQVFNGPVSFSDQQCCCLLAGTRIRTPGGPRAVESLRQGDAVLTQDGRTMPVRWVGRNVIARRFADLLRVLPVRIRAGALDENVPSHDLLLSPNHAVRVGDVLVQAGVLVNGTSVVREPDGPETFTYYHLELDTHALVIAEGAAVESFLDAVEDLGFENWDERVAPAAVEELPYPRVKAARQLPLALRRHLADRAAAVFCGMAEAA